jgi:putative aldouronate transport system permease protein
MKEHRADRLIPRLKRYAVLYLLIIIPLAYYVIYRYYPMLLQFVLSFKQYRIKDGVWGSPRVGFENFYELFSTPEFQRIFINTIRISILRLIVGFFPPIILAIFLFDMSSTLCRRISQSILYIPHFFSWVIVYAIVFVLFSNTGWVNSFISGMGGDPKDFLIDETYFLPLLIGSALWKELGWGTIIYLAALTGINTELFEAAKIDGAGPFKRIRHITLPGILPVMVFVLTISLGRLLSNVGTEQILLFYSPATYSVGDVIGTWIYRQGLGKLKYSLGAAVSLFESTVGLLMVLACNKLANKVAGVGIW